MTIFEKVKASVTIKDAAEHYGIKLASNNMICCPFHDDRHPSMKLNDNYFYCFGCGETGDVVDFVSKLFGIKPFEAAQRLAADFVIDTDSPIIEPPVTLKHPKVKAFREDELYCFRVLCAYLHILENWKISYAPKAPDNELDDRFVEACQMLDYIEYLVDYLTVTELEDKLIAVQELLADGKMTELEERVIRIRKEETQ